MATLPKATTVVSDTAGAQASGVDLVCILNPCATSADYVPRLFGNAAAAYAQHGYSDAIEYAALHVARTGLPFLMVGLAIATPGVVSRIDQSGNTGTSSCTPTAGGTGVLGRHDGVVSVTRGGVVGTDQIILAVSLDGGLSSVAVRLGIATTYALLYVGVSLVFVSGGTLVAGDTIATWHGSAPRSDATGWAAARAALAAQQKGFRSALLCGALQNATEANAFLAQINAYETSNERFIYARASVPGRLPLATMARVKCKSTPSQALTFAEVGASGDTITRAAGSWVTDGFVAGMIITIAGSVSNNVTGAITDVSATVLTLDTADLTPETPTAGSVTITGTPAVTFAEVGATGDTITRSSGSFIDDGFKVGDTVKITGTASNDGTTDAITAVSATVLTLGTYDLVAEAIGATSITVQATITRAAHVAAREADFAAVNGFRLDLGYDTAHIPSPFSGWAFRQPVTWDASLREYAHDLHVATWRKSDGPTGASMFDASGTLEVYDDRTDGGAASAARFTSYRTWGNGPTGAFISQSLTRGDDASLLSLTHNVAVVNLACTVVQLNTENVVGRSLTLNADGTATTDALRIIAGEINAALELALLQNAKGEGPRASRAVWTPSASDILNVPDARLTGVLDLNLNGTIHFVNTSVRVRTGGQ